MTAFIHRGRVAFHETDAAGIVHFANFFLYAEEAETAALASLGLAPVEAARYAYPRVQAEARYDHPLRFHEAYEVHTSITRAGESSLRWRFDICGEWGGRACVQLTSARRHLQDGSKAPYSPGERRLLQKLVHTEEQ